MWELYIYEIRPFPMKDFQGRPYDWRRGAIGFRPGNAGILPAQAGIRL